MENISKSISIPLLNFIGEKGKSLEHIIRVGLPSIHYDIFEGRVIEPHGFETEGSIMGARGGG